MYSCQLKEAVRQLEGAFGRCPAAMMQVCVCVSWWGEVAGTEGKGMRRIGLLLEGLCLVAPGIQ